MMTVLFAEKQTGWLLAVVPRGTVGEKNAIADSVANACFRS
jgi:hypothetical protein